MSSHSTDDLAADMATLIDDLLRAGVEGHFDSDTFATLCDGVVAAGIPLDRSHMVLRAHHPEIGSRAYRWRSSGIRENLSFERSNDVTPDWVQSPLFHLLKTDTDQLRQRLTDPDPALWFPLFDELRAVGATDYFALKRAFSPTQSSLAADPTNPPEGLIISFVTHADGGFTDAHRAALQNLLPALSITLKSGANRQMAQDITATYLGADAGRRVLSGDITRGSSQVIPAVIWYFDLHGFTKLSEILPGRDIIDMLNDYFGEVVQLVEQHGGNVLKFMGDGMLAIFDRTSVPNADAVAVEAATQCETVIAALNDRRAAAALPVTDFALALHAGDVLYGNIGGRSRLDFTVIGPAVNTTARILGMCSGLDQRIVISATVAAPLRAQRPDLVSLGQYRLRGVSDRQELFTLDGHSD